MFINTAKKGLIAPPFPICPVLGSLRTPKCLIRVQVLGKIGFLPPGPDRPIGVGANRGGVAVLSHLTPGQIALDNREKRHAPMMLTDEFTLRALDTPKAHTITPPLVDPRSAIS